tara:strand:- start:2264 stop:3067 length:804 start_codon:yes stop_codon:yes gene_type:complete
MSKYIICAKGSSNVNWGDGSFTTGTPTSQTEAATELIINRLAVIDMLQKGEISKSDCIVTLPERKFLYQNLFNNVEVWSGQTGIDIVSGAYWDKLPYKPFYNNYERDKELIFNIPYNNNIINSDLGNFLVCIPRLKNSDIRRNLPQNEWKDFINYVKTNFDKIIVFGKGNELLDNGNDILYVDTLQDYCSYLHHKNCKHVVSTISGPCHYVQQFGNVNGDCILTMIDNHGLIKAHGNDPSYFHPCINFTNVKINYVNNIKNLKEQKW